MKIKILLIGTNGQIGRELQKLLPRIGEVTSLDRSRLNLAQPEEVRRAIRTFHPQIIVNAAAYTAVDKAESEEAAARAINAEAPGIMAEEAKRSGAALIHYSTDYVFDGSKATPYSEADSTNPLNAYGRTKLEGELAIQASGASYLIFRTSWVYATQGKNFLLTILRLATQREELRIVRDQTGAPTLNSEIARATTAVLAHCIGTEETRFSFSDVSGIYHMTAGGLTNWYDFAKSILELATKVPATCQWFAAATNGLPVITRRVIPIPAKEHPSPAQRPAYSVLSNALLHRTFALQLPDWRQQLSSAFDNVI